MAEAIRDAFNLRSYSTLLSAYSVEVSFQLELPL